MPLIEAVGLDHAGINVPDAEMAAAFFADLLGTRIVADMRPGPVDAAWKQRFRWHDTAEIRRIVMLQAPDGAKIELFEYAALDAAAEQPHQDDPGASHIAFRVPSIDQALAAVQRRGLTILNAPISNPDGVTWFYVLTPWRSQIEFVSAPAAPVG